MKCVIIINEKLTPGLIANASAVLAMSIGKEFPHLVGPDVLDSNDQNHPGITQISIPLLKGNDELIQSIRRKVHENASSNIYMVDFCNVAQKSKEYKDYTEKMQTVPADQISYLGLGLYGSASFINKLTGSAPLLK